MGGPCFKSGIDYPGGDLPNMPIDSASVSDCQKKCQAYGQCALFATDAAGHTYWLKNVQNNQVNNAACMWAGKIVSKNGLFKSTPSSKRKA